MCAQAIIAIINIMVVIVVVYRVVDATNHNTTSPSQLRSRVVRRFPSMMPNPAISAASTHAHDGEVMLMPDPGIRSNMSTEPHSTDATTLST